MNCKELKQRLIDALSEPAIELTDADLEEFTPAETPAVIAALDPFQSQPRWDGVERRKSPRVGLPHPVRVFVRPLH